MVGDLAVATAGYRSTLRFLGDEVVLRVPSLRVTQILSDRVLPVSHLLGRLVSLTGMRIRVRVGIWPSFQLFPDPGWVVRWISPASRRLMRQVGHA